MISNSEHVKIGIIYKSIYLKGIKWDEMTLCVDPIFSWRIKNKRFLHGMISVKWYSKKWIRKIDTGLPSILYSRLLLTLLLHDTRSIYFIFAGVVEWVTQIRSSTFIFRRKNVLDCCVLKWSRRKKNHAAILVGFFFHVWQFYDKSIFFSFETLRFDKLWHYRMNSKQGNF